MSYDFNGFRAGDSVYYVPQSRNGKAEGEYKPIERMGRKYGYINRDRPFQISTGHSHHKEINMRLNGYGFDIYPSKEHYDALIFARDEKIRLQPRLVDYHGCLNDFSPEVVQALHAVLDAEGLQ